MKPVVVKQDKDAPVPVEVLAAGILAISEGVKKLRAGRLNDNALVLLITHAAPGVGRGYAKKKISAKEVRAVLEGIEQLEATYLKKVTK